MPSVGLNNLLQEKIIHKFYFFKLTACLIILWQENAIQIKRIPMNILQSLNKLTQAPLDHKLNKNKESEESKRKCIQKGGTHCKEASALTNVI